MEGARPEEVGVTVFFGALALLFSEDIDETI